MLVALRSTVPGKRELIFVVFQLEGRVKSIESTHAHLVGEALGQTAWRSVQTGGQALSGIGQTALTDDGLTYFAIVAKKLDLVSGGPGLAGEASDDLIGVFAVL